MAKSESSCPATESEVTKECDRHLDQRYVRASPCVGFNTSIFRIEGLSEVLLKCKDLFIV